LQVHPPTPTLVEPGKEEPVFQYSMSESPANIIFPEIVEGGGGGGGVGVGSIVGSVVPPLVDFKHQGLAPAFALPVECLLNQVPSVHSFTFLQW